MVSKEYYLWDELEIGRRFPQVEYIVKDQTITEYNEAVQEKNDIYLSKENALKYGFDSTIAPPTMAAIYVMEAFKNIPAPPGGIHAKQMFEFIKPTMAGDLLRTSVVVVDKYIKRNKKYVEMASETLNQEGDIIVKSLMTRIWSK
ncbi:acyl dehydratase [Neobacillus niacini]|uniref:MaoC family dehydratase n=1 Tax=Neobacillus niacini TaxID=86668 RepID=UPI002782EA95|nr:MaoC family dehydratase N-terminal domain-containing protein [Neobacillus niacini]MDQ1002664.1 acyl dehydratase [Neobacillus niacini]